MSISLPSYVRRETVLLSRRHRVLAIVFTGLKRELRRPAAIFAIAAGTLLTTVISIVLVFFASFLLQGQTLDLTFFYVPASNPAILFFVTLMAAVVGSGLIADDRSSMALTLYLSRPITHADYLLAKASIVGPLVSMISVLPLVITPIVAGLLGLFGWGVALQAVGAGVALGLLLAGFYTAVSLFLSSLTSRRGYAAAGVFAITFGIGLPAELLAGGLGEPSLLYLSPWQDFLAVARGIFGAPQSPIDWAPALAILLAVAAVAALATYLRMRMLEVVTG